MECLQLLVLLLPSSNSLLLKALLQLLFSTCAEPANKMTAQTLGTLFAPHVLSCRPVDAQSLKLQAEAGNTALLMAFMIENVHNLFKVVIDIYSFNQFFNFWNLIGSFHLIHLIADVSTL